MRKTLLMGIAMTVTPLCGIAGGLEIYCVNSLYEDIAGIWRTTGIAISATKASTRTLAHEIGHACGLKDIYDQCIANGVLVSEERVGSRNWSGGTGTGYYPPTLEHYKLLSRLLMYARGDEAPIDIPLGNAMGNDRNKGVTAPLEVRNVGLDGMSTRTPVSY